MFFFKLYGDPRDLHVLTHSFPTRRSSDLYQLAIEPGTRFATEAAAGRLTIPDADAAADLFEATRAMTAAVGLPAYEISNHARPGAASRHNLTYWRYGDYLGVGPGAHGRGGGCQTFRRRRTDTWLATLTSPEGQRGGKR